MLDDIVDQKKALGLVYQRIVYHRGPHDHQFSKELAARALDIIVGREVHGMTFAELAREHGLCKQRVSQIHAKTMRMARDTIRANMSL
jgi:DNA-directed RNA polymerase sigma subunit (sigma70/sigma32)|tara:strand:+ start:1609 stop:1872 length:264 start_codon:yes stop_codon:yes gene_type:complete